jgi:hypothetical protein
MKDYGKARIYYPIRDPVVLDKEVLDPSEAEHNV